MAAFWEKIQFWKPKKKTPEYRFQNSPMDDSTWVEITSGEYANTVYSYGTVNFSDEFGVPKLNFNYMIHYPGQHDIETLKRDQNFVIVMGDILTEIIMDGKNESTRIDDPEEPDLQ